LPTGPKTEQLINLTQLMRLIMNKPQMPARSAALRWLTATSKKLGESRTEFVCTGPRQLEFVRSADTPFTAIELQFLADWLESTQFPKPGFSKFKEP
jgi:hypothetical protein